MNDNEAFEFFRNVYTLESRRDRQKKIGPSEFSTLCDRCVARRLSIGVGKTPKKEQRVYDMGARNGTAIHMFMEENASTFIARKANRELYEGAAFEIPVVVGTLDGYGTIRGTADCVLEKQRRLFDWKTTTTDKLERIKTTHEVLFAPSKNEFKYVTEQRYTLLQYVGQANLYAYGLKHNHKTPVDNITIGFICRDGKRSDQDLWAMHLEYDEDWAETLIDRLGGIWNRVLRNESLDDFDTIEGCYNCRR